MSTSNMSIKSKKSKKTLEIVENQPDPVEDKTTKVKSKKVKDENQPEPVEDKTTKVKSKKVKEDKQTNVKDENQPDPVEDKSTKVKSKKVKDDKQTNVKDENQPEPVEDKSTKVKSKKVKNNVQPNIQPVEQVEQVEKPKKNNQTKTLLESTFEPIKQKSNTLVNSSVDLGSVDSKTLETNNNHEQHAQISNDYSLLIADFNKNKELYDNIYSYIKKIDFTESIIVQLEQLLSDIYDKNETFNQHNRHIQNNIDKLRHTILNCVSSQLTNDQLLTRYKQFVIQYTEQNTNWEKEIKHEFPNKMNIIAQKLHDVMEKNDDTDSKTTIEYKLDKMVKKPLINNDSDKSDSETDSDKPTIKKSGKKKFKRKKHIR